MAGRRANGEGSIYQTRDGRWRGCISLAGGQRKYLTGATRKEVAEMLSELARRNARGQVLPDQRLSLDAWLTRWLDEAVHGQVEVKTERDYRDIVSRHLIPHLGGFRLIALQPHDVTRLHALLLESGLSTATVHKVHRVLARSLAIAVRWGLIDRNAAALVSAPKIRSKAITPLSDFEILELRRHCRDSTESARLYLALLGLRQGEVLGLTWDDIDLESGALTVRHSLQRVPGGRARLKEPKSEAGRRVILVPELVTVVLSHHRRNQLKSRLSSPKPWPDGPAFVFTNRWGGALDARNDYRWWKDLLVRSNVSPRRLHDARHTAASLLLSEGVGVRAAMSWLGHSQVSQTMRYTHVMDDVRRDTSARLGKGLFKE